MQQFVQNINGQFSLNGKRLRFIGANVYELANLDTPITQAIINDAAECGFTALRFWLFENKDVRLQVRKLHEICDMVNPYNIKLIVSLSDKWGYMQNYKINEAWYEGGYKTGYLDYVKTVTSECSERDEIMVWELINEPETDSFGSFYNFAKHVSDEIKTVNSYHLLSTGTVGGVGDKFGSYFSVFKKSNFRKLYTLPSLDAVSIHDYSYDSGIFERLDVLNRFTGNEKRAKMYGRISDVVEVPFKKIDEMFLNRDKLVHIPLTLRGTWNSYNKSDLKFAQRVNKPLYIGEVGFKASHMAKRIKILELDIAQKFAMGISGYMLWSFEAQGWSRDGHSYGFNTSDGFDEIIKKWNKKLNE